MGVRHPPHVDRTDCWCQPRVYQVCPACEGKDEKAMVECWNCAHEKGAMPGLVKPYADSLPLLVVHRELG